MEGQVNIVNKLGLHARAAAKFIQVAKSYSCGVLIGPNADALVNGKSIMQVMTLAAGLGTSLILKTEGDEADEAYEELSQLIASRFGEDE